MNVKIHRDKTALHLAVDFGDREMINMLLDNGAKIDIQDSEGRTALHLAAASSRMESVEIGHLLLNHHANPNLADVSKKTPLHLASASGKITFVNKLLEFGAGLDTQDSKGRTALHFLASLYSEPSPVIIKQLLRKNANPNLKDLTGKTSLHYAVSSGNAPVVKALLEMNQREEGPALENNLDLLVNPLDLNEPDQFGESPLHKAVQVQSYNPELLSLLLQRPDMKLNLVDFQGNTPLHSAAECGNAEAVTQLIAFRGSRIDPINHLGKTPFQVAAETGSNLNKGLFSSFDRLLFAGARTFSQVMGDIRESILMSDLPVKKKEIMISNLDFEQRLREGNAENNRAVMLRDKAYDIVRNYLYLHREDPEVQKLRLELLLRSIMDK